MHSELALVENEARESMSVASATQNPFLLTLPQVLSGRKKLALVAAEYDVDKNPLHAFQTRALTPTQFREQLRRLFALQLTDSELGGLVALFDKDGVGMVDCTTFLNEFFRLGTSCAGGCCLQHEVGTMHGLIE